LRDIDPIFFVAEMLALVLGITLHEFCHAKFADMAGDPTPRMMGRVTLNPLKHLDPVGSIFMLISSLAGIGIGWGRPVMVRPDRMRNPRWDHFVSVLAGPVSNLAQAVLYGAILRVMMMSGLFNGNLATAGLFAIFLYAGVVVNVGMFVFNLIPLGPLDGHWLVGAFLPDSVRVQWYQFNRGIGSYIFLFLVLMPSGSPFDLLGKFFYPIVRAVMRLVLGTGI
jgi:Zn-dependent protease